MRLFAIAMGLALLAAAAHTTIIHTGGYTGSHAVLTLAVAAGVGVGAITIGSAIAERRYGLAWAIGFALLCGEMFGLISTAERLIATREAAQAPMREAVARKVAAQSRVAAAERTLLSVPTTSDRLTKAEQLKAEADKAAVEKAAEKGCAFNCRALLEQQVGAAGEEVTRARAELAARRTAAEADLQVARAALDAIRLPESATPLADRLGVPAWVLDLITAALGSIAANGLAAGLLAYGAHRRHPTPAPVSTPTPEPVEAVVLEVMPEPEPAPAPQPIALGRPTGSVATFILEQTVPAKGKRLEWGAAHEAYRAWCEAGGVEAFDRTTFEEQMQLICQKAELRTLASTKKRYVLDVKLVTGGANRTVSSAS